MIKYKKRADGRYAAQILIGYKDDGKRNVKTIYGRTITDLDKKVREFKNLLDQGVIIDPKDYTLATWTEEWLNTYGSKGLRYTTIRAKRCDIKHITNSPIAQIPFAKIHISHLQQIINDVWDIAPSKVRKIYNMLVNIFECAIKNNLVIKNIAKSVELPKYTNKPKRALTQEEQTAFRTADLTLQEKVFVSLAMDCGLRKGEILALSLNDFNAKDETVDIHKTYDITSRLINTNPKTDSGNRTVPVQKNIIEDVRKLARTNNDLQLFLFKDKPISGKKFSDTWCGIIKKVIHQLGDTEIAINNIRTSDLTPHFLRHTYATNLFYAGVDIKAAQYLMGHSNIETTLKIYTHLQLDNDDIKTKLFTYINRMEISQQTVN